MWVCYGGRMNTFSDSINGVISIIGFTSTIIGFIYVGRKLQLLDDLKETSEKIKHNVKVIADFLTAKEPEFDVSKLKHYSPLRLTDHGMAFIKTPKGREFWDTQRIKLPIFGPIAHKICLARFTRTLASLVRSGVPILEVLNIVSQTVGNVVMEKAIKSAALDIERGEGISAALSKHPVFPTMVIRMLSAGEQTGNIDNMLERVAKFLDEEIEATLSGLMSLIEPLLIVFLGIIIGGMVICMFLPIFNLANVVSGSGH